MADAAGSRIEKRVPRRAGNVERTEYLAFVLAGETYGVKVVQVAEILRPPPITEIPRAPSDVLGIIGVRGRLVTVVDLRRRFRRPEAAIDRKTRVLLADVGTGEQIGFLVDEVQQVWRLAPEEIEPANVLGGEQPAHIDGIGRPDAETVLILLDLQSIVEAPQRVE